MYSKLNNKYIKDVVDKNKDKNTKETEILKTAIKDYTNDMLDFYCNSNLVAKENIKKQEND